MTDVLKELGIETATQEQALWIKQRDGSKEIIKKMQEALIIEEAILKLAESKLG
mgnify:CR=1 FL=1